MAVKPGLHPSSCGRPAFGPEASTDLLLRGVATRDPYFEGVMPERQALVWAAAVRRQLERWEPLVARHTLLLLEPTRSMPTVVYFEGETERHLLLSALRNLLIAIRLMDHPPKVNRAVADEMIQTRDLNEHWDENMPVFAVTPRSRDPQWPSGKAFADRNRERSPYCWWAWDSQRGPLVSPNVSATQIHELVEATIVAAVAAEPQFAGIVADAAPRPWRTPVKEGDSWWPELG